MAFFHFCISHNFRMNWARKLGQKPSWSSFLADLEYHNDNTVWIFGIRNSIEFRIMEKWIRKSNFSWKHFQYNQIFAIFGLALILKLTGQSLMSAKMRKKGTHPHEYMKCHFSWTDWATMLRKNSKWNSSKALSDNNRNFREHINKNLPSVRLKSTYSTCCFQLGVISIKMVAESCANTQSQIIARSDKLYSSQTL